MGVLSLATGHMHTKSWTCDYVLYVHEGFGVMLVYRCIAACFSNAFHTRYFPCACNRNIVACVADTHTRELLMTWLQSKHYVW